MTSLAETIQNLMTELRSDKKIFENFEIDSGFAHKYQAIEGNAKIFDFWYDKFKEIGDQVAQVQSQANEYESIMNSMKIEMQKQFENCHICATELATAIRDFKNYSVSQLRANIDFLKQKTTIMLLFKTTNKNYPEEFDDYILYRKAIYAQQEECNAKSNHHRFIFKSIFFDDNINIDSITRDFPISIRLPQNAVI
jgi:hypothetical protein